MGNKFMNKVWGMLGVESDDDYYDDYDSTANNNIDDKGTSLTTTNNNKKNKVVGMPGMQQVKVIISQPSTFEQSVNI